MALEFISINDSDDDLVPLPTEWDNVPHKSNLTFMQKDESSKKSILLPQMPWKNWQEFKSVYHNLFHHLSEQNHMYKTQQSSQYLKSETDSMYNLKYSYSMIEMWRNRTFNHVPICVDVTQQIMHSLYLFNGSNECLRRLLAINITRATNRLVDKKYGKSTVEWARKLSFPTALTTIRHDIVHERLPSMSSLKQHAMYLLKWLHVHYWQNYIDKVEIVTHTQLARRIASNRKRNKDFSAIFQEIRDYKYNRIAIMEYFIPIFVEECLLNIVDTNTKEMDASKSMQRMEEMFTILFVKYNTFIVLLLERKTFSIAYLVMLLLQKRYKIKHDSQTMQECDEIQCNLAMLWSHSFLSDNDYNKYWKKLNRYQVIFVFKNILQSLMHFNDYWSRQIIQGVHKKAKQFNVLRDVMPTIKSIRVLHNYIEPLKRGRESDDKMCNLIKERLQTVQFDKQLMSLSAKQAMDIRRKNNIEEDEDDEEDMTEDSDMDQEEDNDNREACKWEKSSDCQFLPIGQSILPPL